MITYTGTHVTKTYGAPNLRDMAVQGMRLVRFSGAYEKYFWPIGMHSLLVADLLPKELEHHGLLHDVASEVVMNDIARPHKTKEQKEHEHVLTTRTYAHIGLALPTEKEEALIKKADMEACNAEGAFGCGPRGYIQTQNGFELNQKAGAQLKEYLKSFEGEYYSDLLRQDGYWPLFFEGRLRSAIRNVSTYSYQVEVQQ